MQMRSNVHRVSCPSASPLPISGATIQSPSKMPIMKFRILASAAETSSNPRLSVHSTSRSLVAQCIDGVEPSRRTCRKVTEDDADQPGKDKRYHVYPRIEQVRHLQKAGAVSYTHLT